ncbi:hypothetical protein Cgig2_006484 [Carnegiea gigantea]|uniref:glycerophosphodiester phosphodiesterase n=1 Tax=Carnegiea gigantea TaxID=171969 RepID=A0A9Q1QG87_9CARY|nr:hypothetical protein Cgig2_006484 [Carnegiea gigantea]
MKENSILSFNATATFNIDYIESDVQGTIYEKRVTGLNLCEFVAYAPQKEAGEVGKPLQRETKDGKIIRWDVTSDDTLCTLQEAFEKVDPKLGFNIEQKFDDNIVYQEDFVVAFEYAQERPIIFSTFQPDAALHMRKLQSTYPVLFLTNGGTEIYYDVQRNSLEEALKLCLEAVCKALFLKLRRSLET